MVYTQKNSLAPMLIIGFLFFIFGFVTWLNGSLIPFLQIAFNLKPVQAYLISMCFYISYTVMAIPLSLILNHTGYKFGIAVGLLLMMLGSLIFIPAAQMRSYPVFLVGLFVLGSGLTIQQTASTPYVVLIGSIETAAVRISIMGIINKTAGVIAPIVFTALVLGHMPNYSRDALSHMTDAQRLIALNSLSAKLVTPYLIMAIILLILAMLLILSPLPEPDEDVTDELKPPKKNENPFDYPHLILGVIALFFAVGTEVISGDTIGVLGKELNVKNFSSLTSYTMSFMVLGYVIGVILIPRWISQEKSLFFSALLGTIISVFVVHSSGHSHSIWNHFFSWTAAPAVPNVIILVALFGLANAVMWPAIWPMALRGLSRKTMNIGSAMLTMSIAGGALMPVVYAQFGDKPEQMIFAYWVMIPCYLFILFYAAYGHKITRWKHAFKIKSNSSLQY